MKVSGMDCRRE
jgi:hypothetical protein